MIEGEVQNLKQTDYKFEKLLDIVDDAKHEPD